MEVKNETYTITSLSIGSNGSDRTRAKSITLSEKISLVEAQKKAKDEFTQTLNFLVTKKIEDAQVKVIGDLGEQRCVSYYRQKLESLNIGYQVGDNCVTLKALVPKPE